ncbi:MAG TPA: hypothetical protein VIJ32_14350 [Actinomycetes bacterium]
MVGYPVTDEFSHQFLGLITRTDLDGRPNPFYDNVDGEGPPDGRVGVRSGYIRSAYHEADAKLGLTRRLMPDDAVVMASSDHGFGAAWEAVNAARSRHRPAAERAAGQLPAGRRGRPDHQGQGLLRRRDGPDLPEPGRPRPARPGPAGRLRQGP